MSEHTPKIEDYVDVSLKASALDCNVPEKFCILPRNFANASKKDELLHEESTTTIIKILKKRRN